MRTLRLTLAAIGEITVLLLVLMWQRTVCAEEPDGIDLRAFHFTCEFHAPVGKGRLEGLALSDGTRMRITTYWIEPGGFRESPFFVRYSDFLFTTQTVHYWIQGMFEPETFHLSGAPRAPLLPEQRSPEAVVRAALAAVNSIRHERAREGAALEVGRFFRESRTREAYSCRAMPEEPHGNDPSSATTSYLQILNVLPYGRRYAKETRSVGTLVWSVRKAVGGQPVLSMTITPYNEALPDRPALFDPGTLGQGTLVPEAYRRYWSFDQKYAELGRSSEPMILSRELCDRIESYLQENDVPAAVRRGLERLCFQTALLSEDRQRVYRALQASAAGLCQGGSAGPHQSLLELARITGQIERRYPQQAQRWLRPLVHQMLEHFGQDAVRDLPKLLPALTANQWFTYANLLLEEIREQDLMPADAVESLGPRLEAARMATHQEPPDPCEPSPTVRRYLAQVDARPPRGRIDMNDLHDILEKGLAKCYSDNASEARSQVVESVMQPIRLVIGEGPFRGEPAKLIASIEHFSALYFGADHANESIDTVLATFLALSFCDISTAEDHEMLFSQLQRCSAELQLRVNAMLADRELSTFIPSEDVRGVFQLYERIFRRYIDDPLWPPFKFPFTTNEQARLGGQLKLYFLQLAPFLDGMALKVKYGGTDPELTKQTLFEISRAAQQLLPQAAFLRRPPYPGVSCRYRGRYGFTATIKGPFYQEGNRPKERFRAMKYFHLGHRLEEIVLRERELARPGTDRRATNESEASKDD